MKSQRVRYASLAFFLTVMTVIGYLHQKYGGGSSGYPAVDSLCPFGGLEGLYSYLKDEVWLRRLAPSSLALLISIVVLTIAFGRVFCGWICPMGALTEFTSWLARKLGVSSRRLPHKLDLALRGVKYILLLCVLYFTWHMGTLVFRDYDPWKAWMHLSAGFSEGITALVILGAVLLAEFFVERFWCRYLCPLGAFFSILQKISLVKIKREPALCINCKKCDKICPTGLTPSTAGSLSSADCIACGKCVEACPRDGAIAFGTIKKGTLAPLHLGFISIAIFAVFYGGAKVSGFWSTQAPPPPASANISPAHSLYGWMSLEQISEVTKLSVAQLIEIAELPGDTPSDISIKALPGKLDDIIIARISAWDETDKSQKPLPNIDEIRGSATLRELSTIYGLDADKILSEAKWPEGLDAGKRLKELAAESGKEVSDIREAIKRLLK